MPVKLSKLEREDIYRFYKEELKIMQEKRNQGIVGRIEFTIAPVLDLKIREEAARYV